MLFLTRLRCMQVPREHNTFLDLPSQSNVHVRFRVFVANSEDAKATREYICANRKSPMLILTIYLAEEKSAFALSLHSLQQHTNHA